MIAGSRLSAVLAACLVVSGLATANDWPIRPVTIVVPFAPGGATDIVARLLAEELRQRFDQPFVVQNRTGAAGNIGLEAVASTPEQLSALIRRDNDLWGQVVKAGKVTLH